MKALLLALLLAGVGLAQQVEAPLASFTGTVKQITGTSLTLARPNEDDMEISCTHKTRYFKGTAKIKRDAIKPGDRVSVETRLDPYLKPEAVNVRVLPPE